jgi:hypothetical protein
MLLPFMIVPLVFASKRPDLPWTSRPTAGKLGLSLMDGSVMPMKVVYTCELFVALLIRADIRCLGDCSKMIVRIEA